jgi:hypothetical protein
VSPAAVPAASAAWPAASAAAPAALPAASTACPAEVAASPAASPACLAESAAWSAAPPPPPQALSRSAAARALRADLIFISLPRKDWKVYRSADRGKLVLSRLIHLIAAPNSRVFTRLFKLETAWVSALCDAQDLRCWPWCSRCVLLTQFAVALCCPEPRFRLLQLAAVMKWQVVTRIKIPLSPRRRLLT